MLLDDNMARFFMEVALHGAITHAERRAVRLSVAGSRDALGR